MLTGEIVSQLRVIGPAEPTPTAATRTSWRSAASSCCSTMPASDLKWASGPTSWSTSTTERSSSSPRAETSPEANLVPPMSIASTTSGSLRGATIGAVSASSGAGSSARVAADRGDSFVSKRFLGKARVRPWRRPWSTYWCGRGERRAWVHVPTYGDRSFIAGAAAAVALQRLDADDRVPHVDPTRSPSCCRHR